MEHLTRQPAARKLAAWIAVTVLSERINERLRVRWQASKLASVRSVDFDLTSLHEYIGPTDLCRFFTGPAVDSHWQASLRDVSQFRLPEEAGGVNPGDQRAIYYLLSGLQPSSMLEVGTHIGASTVHAIVALRQQASMQLSSIARLVSVDILDVNEPTNGAWRRYGASHPPRQMSLELGAAEWTTFIAQPSLDYLRSTDETFDFIFLDGDHSAATVYLEMAAALRKLKPNGVILLHDIYPELRSLWPSDEVIPGPWLAVERIKAEGWPIAVTPFSSLPWETKQGRTASTLALLTKASS